MKLLICAVLAAMFSCYPLMAQSDQRSAKEQQLQQLMSKIEKIRKAIEVKETSKTSFNRQLRAIEKKIARLDKSIRDANAKIRTEQRKLTHLRADKKRIQQEIAQQNDSLARQLHTAYTLGQQERLKLLFSQQQPQTLQRNLTYYEYFSKYRLKLIAAGRESYQQLVSTEQQIRAAKLALEQTRDSQRDQHQELASDRNKRKDVVTRLEQELSKQGRQLNALEDDAEELKKLIDSLTDILEEIPDPPSANQKFAELRGKLAWPAKGKVRKLFGDLKPPSSLRWQGVIVEAPEGNNVRAISHGRVAFADYLRGMGNLVIIDHGQGYLSLYGHNQAIYKAAGEWVEAGDIVASIGTSGGQKNPGVYFEIRKKGKPQNPSRWCHTDNWFAT